MNYDVLGILTVVYVLGAIAASFLFMFEDETTFRFSWNAIVWGIAWGPLVFICGPILFVRDVFRARD